MLWAGLALIIYAAGFAATIRIALIRDAKRSYLGQDEEIWLGIMWPVVLLVVIVAAPFVLLYRLAARGLRH